MKENFDYTEVPKNYLHCQNAQCPRTADCLHFLVACHINNETPYFSVVNPAYVVEQRECPFFRPDHLVRFALGITYLFDNLSHAKAVKIKQLLYNHFPQSTFYRIRNKQRLIKPEEQDFIRQVFIKESIEEEPVFDKYVDRYDWG